LKTNNVTNSSDVYGNAAQMEAILHVNGPAMVLAGPGSGKTFVIVQRLRNLIINEKIDPSSILVITFTKAAAIEMQQRFMRLTDSSYPDVVFGTFHSVFYQIIRQSNPSNYKLNIADESIKYKFVREILQNAFYRKKISEDDFNEGIELIKDIISEISRIKNTGIKPCNCNEGIPCRDCFEHIFLEYNKMMKENGFLDFDDMLVKCYELFSADENILKKWQNRFKYILIDEYQDINLLQYRIIKMLCSGGNLFTVGDDDQSIYGFRGSDPGIMQKFQADYKEYAPKVINLTTNYRCGKNILLWATPVIEENRIRFRKKLVPDEKNIDGFIVPRRYINKEQQNKAIIKFLSERKDDLGNIAFIFRTNSQALSLAGVLKSEGIPTNLDNYTRNLTDSPAVKLCISYLSFACLEKKREYFYKIMNKPMRFFSRDCAQNNLVSEAEVIRYYSGNNSKIKDVERFFRQIRMISKMRPSLSVRFLRNEIGIDKLYPGEIDALNELSELSIKMKDNKQLLNQLNEITSDDKNNSNKKRSVKNKGCVKLLTMHGSKGLEFDIVWLPGLNEGIIPSRSANTLEQIEEERRMLYVAMTRAKTALIMSYITGSDENPMLPSRFLRPIKELWNKDNNHSSPSSPSSGSSTISSNSTSSRYELKASATASYSASSLI
jgi:DNA helicase-2/ATP-dependent DNA helicase PcrA